MDYTNNKHSDIFVSNELFCAINLLMCYYLMKFDPSSVVRLHVLLYFNAFIRSLILLEIAMSRNALC